MDGSTHTLSSRWGDVPTNTHTVTRTGTKTRTGTRNEDWMLATRTRTATWIRAGLDTWCRRSDGNLLGGLGTTMKTSTCPTEGVAVEFTDRVLRGR